MNLEEEPEGDEDCIDKIHEIEMKNVEFRYPQRIIFVQNVWRSMCGETCGSWGSLGCSLLYAFTMFFNAFEKLSALSNPKSVAKTKSLSSLTEMSKNESYKFQRLYRNLYNPEFYWLAYKNIYANTGSMTAGADGTTIDGMSDERIAKIIASLRDRSYQPKPARREYIAKKNSNKMRPLGIQSGNDKLVQEVAKISMTKKML